MSKPDAFPKALGPRPSDLQRTDVTRVPSSPPTTLPSEQSLQHSILREPQFVHELKDDMRCNLPTCRKVLLNAMQTNCAHHFCQLCLQEYVRQGNSTCPVGEEDCEQIILDGENANVFPDPRVRKAIQNLEVYCSNKEVGCSATMRWILMDRVHFDMCDYGEVPCVNRESGCMESILRKDLAAHQTKCKHKPKKCLHCEDVVPESRMELHLEENCPNVLRSCPYGCGATSLTKEQIRVHTQTCPRSPRPCAYQSIGCGDQVPSQEMEAHLSKCIEKHLNLCITRNVELEVKVSQQNNEIQRMNNELDILQEQHRGTNANISRRENGRVRDFAKMNANLTEDLLKLQRLLAEANNESSQTKRKISDMEGQYSSSMRSMTETIQRFETTLAQYNVRLSELGKRCDDLEQLSTNGRFVWKLENFRTRFDTTKQNRSAASILSPCFFTDPYGYKMCLRLYMNGDGMGKGTHMSLFFTLLKGRYDSTLEWPFRRRVTFRLLDQTGHGDHITDSFQPDPTSVSFKKPETEMNIASGCPLFVPHTQLESNSKYTVDNLVFIEVVVANSN